MEDESIEYTKTRVKQLLKCGLCSQIFKIPRRLPCAHSFCCSCLQEYCNSLQTKSTVCLRSFQCPTCQMVIGLPDGGGVVDFPIDARIVDIRESAVAEMKDALLKKLLVKKGNFPAESFESGYCDTESQTSDASSQEAKSSIFEDDHLSHMNKKRSVQGRYQTFTDFDARSRNSEAGDETVGRPIFSRNLSKSSSLREIHRRKAQDLMAAFDRRPDFTSADNFSHNSASSFDHDIRPASRSDRNLYRKGTSRYKTHQGINVCEEFSTSNVGNRYGARASEDDCKMFSRSSSSSEVDSKFVRSCRHYQSLRETSSRRPYLSSVESIFHEHKACQNVNSGNDVQHEINRTASLSEVSENKLECMNTTLQQRKEYDSRKLQTTPEKMNISSAPIYNSSDLSVNDSNTVITDSMPIPFNLSKDNKISSKIKRKSTGRTKCTTVFESVVNTDDEDYTQSEIIHCENNGHYEDLSRCQFSSDTVKNDKLCVPEVVIAQPNDEDIDIVGSPEKQCLGSNIFCKIPCIVNKSTCSYEEVDESHEREALQEFDFLMNDDEGIELDSERSDSIASISNGHLEANSLEQHLCTPYIVTSQDHLHHGSPDNIVPVNNAQNSCSNEIYMAGKCSETYENFSSGNDCHMEGDHLGKTIGSDQFEQCSNDVNYQSDNCASLADGNLCKFFNDYPNHSDVVDSGAPRLKKSTKEWTAQLHHVSSEEYLMPTGVAILSQGNTVVADYGVGCLQYYADDGNPLHKIEGIKPFSIAVNPSNNQVIVGDRRKKTICLFDECGCDVAEWDANMFKWICGVGIFRNGDLVVLDREKSQFGIYKPNGQLVYAFGSYGNGEKQLCMGEFLVVDEMDRIVTCDSGNHCVKIFSITGSLLQSFSNRGEEDGELQWPKGVCTDNKNNIIVADTRNSRVSMFSSDGTFIQQLVTNLTLPYAVSYSNSTIAVTMYSVMGQSRFHLYNLYES